MSQLHDLELFLWDNHSSNYLHQDQPHVFITHKNTLKNLFLDDFADLSLS